MRDAEPFSSFEKPLSEGERNRELDSVQLSQMEKDRILSEKGDRAFQGEILQLRQDYLKRRVKLDRRDCKGEVLILLSM